MAVLGVVASHAINLKMFGVIKPAADEPAVGDDWPGNLRRLSGRSGDVVAESAAGKLCSAGCTYLTDLNGRPAAGVIEK